MVIRDNNFNEKQIKGIDLSVKGMKKKYPFVEGWVFTDDYEKWQTHLYINIYVNWKKIGELNGWQLGSHYEKYYESTPERFVSSTISPFFGNGESEEEKKEFREYCYNYMQEFKSDLNFFYEHLPKNLQIVYSGTSDVMNVDYTGIVNLSSDEFIDYRLK